MNLLTVFLFPSSFLLESILTIMFVYLWIYLEKFACRIDLSVQFTTTFLLLKFIKDPKELLCGFYLPILTILEMEMVCLPENENDKLNNIDIKYQYIY